MKDKDKVKVKTYMPIYEVMSNTEEETKMVEGFADIAKTYMREIIIQKDNAFISKWFCSLKDEELIRINGILKAIMYERGIK